MTVANPRRILILGGLSAMAQAVARLHAAQGDRILLLGRDEVRLTQSAADLKTRGAECTFAMADLTKTENAAQELKEWADSLGRLDVIYIFYGLLGNQAQGETDLSEASRIVAINYTSQVIWCLAAANLLETQRSGTLVVIGSVAGDRGRQTNYIYGSAKAGISVLVQGLAPRLEKSGARAVVLKVGFVDTPMTDGIKKGGPLWSTPEGIASAIEKSTRTGGPIQYVPWFWRWILLIVRLLPSPIMHRTKF